MAEIKVPTLGESVSEATVAQWLKKEGETVKADEPIVELETDKVTLEVNAPSDGVITKIIVGEGENVGVDAVLGELSTDSAANDSAPAAEEVPEKEEAPVEEKASDEADEAPKTSPAVRKALADNDLSASDVPASGKDGRLTKEDVTSFIEGQGSGSSSSAPVPAEFAVDVPEKKEKPAPSAAPAAAPSKPRETGPREERVRMTKLRKVIASRLKEAQNTAAVLTTFNEVDMSAVMDLRKQYQDRFVKKYGIKLGFMSFFVKAAIQTLKEFPAVNAEI